MEQIRALVVDDHDLTRVLIATYLESLNADIVGNVGSSREAIQLALSEAPNLAIIDLDLGIGPTGIDLAHGLRKFNKHLAIVILTSYEDPRLLRVKNLDLPAGAVYLGKQDVTSREVLENAIRMAMANMNGSPMEAFQFRVSSLEKLSDSQIEVMNENAAF